MKEKNKLEEIKDKIKRGTAVLTASAILTTQGMLKANGFKKNVENPYAAPAYYDIDLPKSVLKSVSEYLNVSAPDINREDILKIKELVIDDNDITNLDFIINFTNLESLTISGIHITNIDALKDMRIKSLIINYTSISNDDLSNLPGTLEELTICDCPLISDCSIVSEILPNLKLLELNCLASLKSMDFIKNMKLNSLYVNQLGIIDEELVPYLNDNNIFNNITKSDIEMSKQLDYILQQIVNDDMTEQEKIKAVTLYVIKNIQYDLNFTNQSNLEPLKTALDGSGVCLSYSYLMSALLSKLNIESYQIYNDTHAWTLVEKNNKYYYIDSTNLIQNFPFLEKLFEKCGIGLYYMQDPNSTWLSSMDSANSGNVSLDDELFNKIIRGEGDKNIFERYFSNGYLDIVYLASLLTVINVLSLYGYKKQKRKKLENIL